MFPYLIGRCDMRSERSSRGPFEEDEEASSSSSSSVKSDEEHMEDNEQDDESSSSSENVLAANIDLETPSTRSSSSILLGSSEIMLLICFRFRFKWRFIFEMKIKHKKIKDSWIRTEQESSSVKMCVVVLQLETQKHEFYSQINIFYIYI